MEPDREAPGRVALRRRRRGGGYELIAGMVLVDADVFPAAAESGLAALREGDGPRAGSRRWRMSGRAVRGDFLADKPDAEVGAAQRARLRSLAGRVLRALAGIRVRAGELDAAASRSSGSPSSSRSTSRPSARC